MYNESSKLSSVFWEPNQCLSPEGLQKSYEIFKTFSYVSRKLHLLFIFSYSFVIFLSCVCMVQWEDSASIEQPDTHFSLLRVTVFSKNSWIEQYTLWDSHYSFANLVLCIWCYSSCAIVFSKTGKFLMVIFIGPDLQVVGKSKHCHHVWVICLLLPSRPLCFKAVALV